MPSEIGMSSARMQDSPFRETEWDNRLDKMLDDLKTTVSPDGDHRTSNNKDTSLVSSFRSSSRSESRNSNRGIEDLGLMKHHHKEFTSPDKSTRVITDEFEYDSGDPNKHFQKKVKKSTYSSYKVSGGLTDEMDSLRQGPTPSIMADATASDTKVVSASKKVANKLVDALSTIGNDGDNRIIPQSTGTLETTSSDYSTLTRLNKNINELDTLLDNMDMEEREKREREMLERTQTKSQTTQVITTVTEQDKHARDSTTAAAVSTESKDEPTLYSTRHKGLANGLGKHGEEYDVTDGEVKRIVWRNRFEKTYESQDSSVPSLTIEDDARQRHQKHQSDTTKTVTTFHPQVPPVSPGGQPWAEPIPLPTPPQVSPGEPGVAYIYTYGQEGGSQVKHLPPLNYVAAPPPGEREASPTPSGSGQPVIYHYSYHYNIMPGQPLPDGVPHPHGSGSQPALQVVTPPRQHPPAQVVSLDGPLHASSYDYKSHSSSRSDNKMAPHHHHHHFPTGRSGSPSKLQSDPNNPDSNLSIRINKTTTHTTHTKEFPEGPGAPQSTSTPYHTRGRSHSPSPDRYLRGSRSVHTTHTRTSYGNDSLERLKKPTTDGLPFPDTSPIKPSADGTIPRKVDELMHSFDSEDGRIRSHHHYHSATTGPSYPESEPLVSRKVEDDTEFAMAEIDNRDLNKEKSKNVTGPPVYYPPGHQQLFTDSMHTMTLKENKRRGKAKWRAEKAMKEKGSNSDSKGGMAMVPVCLPLCCGAACTIM